MTACNPTDSRHLEIITNADAAWHDRCHGYPQKQRKGGDLMKIDISFLAVFVLIGTDLLARAAVQGVEPALVATAFEYGSAGVIHLTKWVRAIRELHFHR